MLPAQFARHEGSIALPLPPHPANLVQRKVAQGPRRRGSTPLATLGLCGFDCLIP